MEFKEIISVAFASLILLVVTHFVVYWVVRTLYPPPPTPTTLATPIPILEQQSAPIILTEPPSIEQQNVTLPTYEAPVPTKVASEEGERRGPPPAESTSIRGSSGVATTNT